jgi:hypothetical protein
MIDSTGTVWAGLDNPSLYLSRSTDGGATFSPWAAVTNGSINYSAWGVGADVIWVAGYQQSAARISLATPTVATSIGGLVSANAAETALAVDVLGTAYVARCGSGGIPLQRARVADAAFGAAVTVDAQGRYPSLTLPEASDTVIVSYERGGAIWLSVQTF